MDRPLTIVIPVYNEGANFPGALGRDDGAPRLSLYRIRGLRL